MAHSDGLLLLLLLGLCAWAAAAARPRRWADEDYLTAGAAADEEDAEEATDACVRNATADFSARTTYPGQKWPCLHESQLMRTKDGPPRIVHDYSIEKIALSVCRGQLSMERAVEQYGCSTRFCRMRCYHVFRRKSAAPRPTGTAQRVRQKALDLLAHDGLQVADV